MSTLSVVESLPSDARLLIEVKLESVISEEQLQALVGKVRMRAQSTNGPEEPGVYVSYDPKLDELAWKNAAGEMITDPTWQKLLAQVCRLPFNPDLS